MIVFGYLLPFLLGGLVVAQSGLNERIVERWGLTWMTLINSAVLASLSLAVYGVARWLPRHTPQVLKLGDNETPFQWWFVLTGVLGYCIVAGAPLVLERVGALRLFIGMIAGQLLVGLIWDATLENRPVTAARLLGAGLALAGAVVSQR